MINDFKEKKIKEAEKKGFLLSFVDPVWPFRSGQSATTDGGSRFSHAGHYKGNWNLFIICAPYPVFFPRFFFFKFTSGSPKSSVRYF